MELNEKIAELTCLASKLNNRDEIINCFHRYINFYSEQHIDGVMAQFTTTQPDVSLEIGEKGCLKGLDAIRAYFGYMPKIAARPGAIIYHYVDTQVVTIAEDGKTAKLTCLAPGFDADAKSLTQNWVYGKYYADLVREENGEWKLWHVRWFRNFEAPMMIGWLKNQTAHDDVENHPAMQDVYGEKAPFEAGSYPESWQYPKHYSPDEVNYLLPEPPAPYKTWDGMTAAVKTRKE